MFTKFALRTFVVSLSIVVLATKSTFAAAVVPPEGTYTLVALPDTQIYAQKLSRNLRLPNAVGCGSQRFS